MKKSAINKILKIENFCHLYGGLTDREIKKHFNLSGKGSLIAAGHVWRYHNAMDFYYRRKDVDGKERALKAAKEWKEEIYKLCEKE